jgi:hypothetical protein
MFKYTFSRGLNKERLFRKVPKLSLKHFLAILLLVLLVSVTFSCVHAQTDGENGSGETEFESGETHCSLGEVGFVLVIGALAAGFLVSGRFGRISGFKPLPIHKIVVVVMASYLTIVFIYGSTVRNILFINSVHGTLGFLTIAVAWLTVSLNPLFLGKAAKWKRATAIHLILATSLLTLLIIHLAYALSLFGE